MDAFLADANRILETAAAASACPSGEPAASWIILIQPGGALHLIASQDWNLDAAAAHHGAVAAYQVTSRAGRVCVEGRSARMKCRLESAPADEFAQATLADRPRYLLHRAALPPAS